MIYFPCRCGDFKGRVTRQVNGILVEVCANCGLHTPKSFAGNRVVLRGLTEEDDVEVSLSWPKPEPMDEKEYTGGDVNYYVVDIVDPKRFDPYTAECEDIIEALNMNFAEGCAFKAIWRKAAARSLGKEKKGNNALYDAEKIVYYGQRQVVQEQRKIKTQEEGGTKS